MAINNIVIVGPTASGKTQLAIDLACSYNAEIICADSRTVYKKMNIGTAKPSVEQQRLVKHYCLDIVYPDQSFTVADFVVAAKSAEAQIRRNGKKVITVGGSGLFIDAYVYNFSMVPPNIAKRQYYEQWDVAALQAEIIHKNLALPINSKNKRHLIQVLEREGQPAPNRHPIPASTIIIGLSPTKNELLERIT